MGTWGRKTFENDGAADWLYDLEEATSANFVLKPLQAVLRAKGKADLDDSLEGLAAAEVLAGARYEPPRNLPRIARTWAKRIGLVPQNRDLKLAIRAVNKIAAASELADSWKEANQRAGWQRELEKLSQRLMAATRVALPVRQFKLVVHRETLAELIIAVAGDKSGARRPELQRKLSQLSNPDRPIGGKADGQKLNCLTPLHWVASRGLLPEAKLLLARGAKVDPKLAPFASPLDFAMEGGHDEMVVLLLEAGADRDKALSSAISNDDLKMVNLALAHGADVAAASAHGWTPLMWAAHQGAVNALPLLLKRGAKVNCVHENGDMPLHFAADGPMMHGDDRATVRRFARVVKLLVEHGAKPNVIGYEGKTPLDVAEEAAAEVPAAKEIVTFLRKHGARNGKTKRS